MTVFVTQGENRSAPDAASRAVQRCRYLGTPAFSDNPDGLFRPYLGPAHLRTCAQVTTWMEEAGLAVRRDAAGTLIGRYDGETDAAPAFLIGSHLDSVPDGGCFDGVLGVMLGIELVSALWREERRLPFALEVVAFGDEEGSRFPRSMLCSAALAGNVGADMASMRDADGITLSSAMASAGLDVAQINEAARTPGSVLGYLEAHIEQGPLLEQADLAVAAVEAIAGIRRCRVELAGETGHAGTIPVAFRYDALAAASEMVLLAERVGAEDDGLRTLVGDMEIVPGAVNVIPGRVAFLLEVRAGTSAALGRAANRIEQGMAEIAARRGVSLRFAEQQFFPPTRSDPALLERLSDSLERCGQPRRHMLSGAGHDAMMLAELMPTQMLFIRSPGGHSHCPAETVRTRDVGTALAVMTDFVRRLAEQD